MKRIIIGIIIGINCLLIDTPGFSQGLVWGPDTYECTTYRVVDGDTAYLECSLGFGITKDVKVRLEGINAPEIRGQERPMGLKSKKALLDMIEGKNVVLVTRKTGKYGRWIGTIFLQGINVNLWMVRAGHADASIR